MTAKESDNTIDDQKRCIGCGKSKPLSDYYRNKNYKDGRIKHCKPCQSVRAKEYYAKMKDDKHYRDVRNKAHQRYKKRNPAKYLARLQAYVHRKELRGSECEGCGSDKRLEMHHPDYDKPTLVVTLCRICHVGKHNGLVT